MVCYLNIKSSPRGADIYIDGKKIGKTNKENVAMVPGSYKIELKKSGYVSYINLNYKIKSSDLAKTLSVELEEEKKEEEEEEKKKEKEKEKKVTAISINSDPAGADIFIDTIDMKKTTPKQIEVSDGKHEIKLSLAGYKDYVVMETIPEGKIVLRNYKLEKVEETWINKFLNALKISHAAGFNLFYPLSNSIKNEILTAWLHLPDGEKMLEIWADYLFDKFSDEYPEYKVLKDEPKHSLTIAAIIGIVSTIIGFGTLINWLRKELPEPSGMAVWAAIEAEDWETAETANEQYKHFIDISNAWYAQALGFLNPFIWLFMNANKESQLTAYEAYKKIIETHLGVLEIPERVRVNVRDITDGDTIETDIEAYDDATGNKIMLPALKNKTHAGIRIVGINAPEKSPKGEILCSEIEIYKVEKKYADYARDALLPLNDKQIILKIDPEKTTDSYGRILAVVEYDGEDVGLAQIKRGFACWYYREKHKYVDDDIYKEATLAARENKKGMWSEVPEEIPGEEEMITEPIMFTIDSVPTNAKVFIDEIAAHHNTPTDEVECKDVIHLFTEGKHKLRLQKSGYASEQEIELKRGERLTLNIELGMISEKEEEEEKEIPEEEVPEEEVPEEEVPPVIVPETIQEFFDVLKTYYTGRLYMSKKELIELGNKYGLDIPGLE